MMKNATKNDHTTDVEELAKTEVDKKEKGANDTPTKAAKSKNQSKHLCRKPETKKCMKRSICNLFDDL